MAMDLFFCVNDHPDILIEILRRLDHRSLGVAACVCSLWCSISRNDSLWENLCFSHVSSPPPSHVRPVVLALGGYRRLYMLCLRPVLTRLSTLTNRDEQLQLSLALFSVDCYERLLGSSSASSSLMFLCEPLNVS